MDMTEQPTSVPPDNPKRELVITAADAPEAIHIALAGDTYRSGRPARMLCMCTLAGQDEYFERCGDTVADRTAPPPKLSEDEIAERRRRAVELAPHYATELLAANDT